MINDKEMFEAVQDRIASQIPGFSVEYKTESLVSKIIGVLVWPFNREYMTSYTTTRYPHVFFPSREFVEGNYRRAWKILCHEYVHLVDRLAKGVWFDISYLSMQLWAVFSLSALSAIWVGPIGLLGLTALIFALPWPSPGRREAELRGYTMSMAVNHWRYGDVHDTTKDWMVQHFTGSDYYFMWPFKNDMRRRLYDAEFRLDDGTVFEWDESGAFYDIHDFLKMMGWIK